MNKNIRTTLNTLVFLTLGILLFYWAVSRVGLQDILEDIRKADLRWILLAMLCGILSHLGRSLRWNLLLEPMGHRAREATNFHAVILGYLVNMAVPRLGEVARPAVVNKLEGIPFNKLIGTVLVERVVDLIITLLIAVAIFLMQFQLIADFFIGLLEEKDRTQTMVMIGVLVFAVIVGILGLLYRKRLYRLPIIERFKGFLEGIVEGLQSILKIRRIGLFIFYSLFIWSMYFMMPFLVFFALEGTSHLGPEAGLTVLLFGTAAMIVPVPGGLGTFEVLVPAALVLYGIGDGVGQTYAVLTHAVQVLLIFAVGIISTAYFLWMNRKKNNQNDEVG